MKKINPKLITLKHMIGEVTEKKNFFFIKLFPIREKHSIYVNKRGLL